MSDEVREFHLDGKQLAFLVISAIGVSVVVFLCGVMVGRGVPRLSADERAGAARDALTAPAPDTGTAGVDVPVATGGRNPKEKNPIPDVNVSYPERLASPRPDAVSEPVPAPKATRAAPPAPARAPSVTTAGTKEPLRGGFDVQVMALKQSGSAENVRRQLETRHNQYKAFVSEGVVGGQRLFRVRVGTFATKPEADAVAARLKKDFKNPRVVPH